MALPLMDLNASNKPYYLERLLNYRLSSKHNNLLYIKQNSQERPDGMTYFRSTLRLLPVITDTSALFS